MTRAAAAVFALGLGACADDDAGMDPNAPIDAGAGNDAGFACPPPDSGLYAVFEVVDETYRVHITNPATIDAALALWETGEQQIPNGELVCEPAEFNCGYSWHVAPGTLGFADITIEACDGRPSYVDTVCEEFVDNYCPWSAELVELYDCREGPCTPVAR